MNKQTDIKNNTVVSCNKNLPPVKAIKQYSDVPHGKSLLAMFMIDKNNMDIQLTMSFDNDVNIDVVLDELLAHWRKFEPIRTNIRSLKRNGRYVDELDGYPLQAVSGMPESEEVFDKKHVIVDIEQLPDFSYEIKLYRWAELKPRVLILNHK